MLRDIVEDALTAVRIHPGVYFVHHRHAPPSLRVGPRLPGGPPHGRHPPAESILVPGAWWR